MNEPKSLPRKRRSVGVALAVALVAVVVAGMLFIYRQRIHDQLIVWQYTPTNTIAALAERTTMTDAGQFYFYASRPVIEDNQQFNASCSRQERHTAILGCYSGMQIFIFNVQDRRLDGILEVTAAHEMLHAAYMRLSPRERMRVDALLDQEYAVLKDEPKFADRMAFYDRTEPGEHHNELHSIVGTEVEHVSDELAAYYARYFKNRQEIVALHDSYERVFTTLVDRAEELSSTMLTLAESIKRDSEHYNNEVAALNATISAFNDRARGDGFQSQSQFQAERGALVAKAETLEKLRKSVNRDIERYNTLREELEQVSSQSQALNRSIDSTLAPSPSI